MNSAIKKIQHRVIAGVSLCLISAGMFISMPSAHVSASMFFSEQTENIQNVSIEQNEQSYNSEDVIPAQGWTPDVTEEEPESESIGTLVSVRASYPIHVTDPEMFEDEAYIARVAVPGVMAYEYSADGTLLSETELIAAQSQIIVEGTKRRVTTGKYIVPAVGKLSSGFGHRTSSGVASTNHKGIDIANRLGTIIVAAEGGTVIFAGSGRPYTGFGNIVVIEHENGDLTYYGHMNKISTKVGAIVYQGDKIGTMGNTGNSTGVHLHFEYHPAGREAVDPLTVLPEFSRYF